MTRLNQARQTDLAQSIHILKKDIHCLRAELGLVAVLLIGFGLTHARFPDYPAWALLGVGGAYLIARLIHAESIPGSDGFWKTRPYRWQSLLAAKLAFIGLFFNLPLFLVQLVLFLGEGFGIPGNLPGILWSQFLMLFLVSLPMAALASMTRGIRDLALAALVLVSVGILVESRMLAQVLGWPEVPDWKRYSLAAALLLPSGMAILYLQYRSHRTRTCRAIAASAAVLAFVGTSFTPPSLARPLQSHLAARDRTGAPGITIRLEPSARMPSRPVGVGRNEVVILLPLRLRSDEGVLLDPYEFDFELETAQGEKLTTLRQYVSLPGVGESGLARVRATLSREVLDAQGRDPVRIRGTVGMGLLGDPREDVFDLSRGGFRVGSVHCAFHASGPISRYERLECRSPFRWPSVWIQTDFVTGELKPLRESLPYSPYPGGLDLNWVASEIVAREPQPRSEIRVVTRRLRAYVRKSFEIDIDLNDFVVD